MCVFVHVCVFCVHMPVCVLCAHACVCVYLVVVSVSGVCVHVFCVHVRVHVCVPTVQVKNKFPFHFRTTVVQRCCVLKNTVQKRSMNGTVAFLLTVLLHVYMMKRFPLPST